MRVMLGVDIGGTKIGLGRVGPDGSLRGPTSRSASDTRSSDDLIRGLLEALRLAVEAARRDGFELCGVGLGCAGTVDRARGSIVISPNLPLRDVPLSRLVSEELGLPAALDNDANVAALAEARVGAAAGLRHVAMLTLGTGVGGGLILDGRLYRGATGAAAELGHTIVAAGGERCRCGAFGCLEAYASGTALVRIAARLIDTGGRPPRLGAAGPTEISGWAATPGVLDPQRAPDRVPPGRGEGGATEHTMGGEDPAEDAAAGAAVSIDALAELRAAGGLDGESIGRLALAGDPGALTAVTEVGAWLGVGVVNLANMFEPEAVVVGGGLGVLGELLLGPARLVLEAGALAPNKQTRLVSAAVGADAGTVGAGLLAWEEIAGGGG